MKRSDNPWPPAVSMRGPSVVPMLWQVTTRLYEQQPSTQCRLPPVIAVWSTILVLFPIGAALFAVKRCCTARVRLPAHDSRGAHGLLC
jgi:hypothetical protein